MLDTNNTVYLIDGSSFLYRAYYGLRPLHTSKGVPVHAVYSFCRMIRKLIDDAGIKYIVLVWDSKGKTTRHEMYKDYKATRQAPPSDIFDQKELIVEFADLIDMAQIAMPGIEADDIMYSIAKEQVKQGKKIVFVTADKDMGQAISDDIYMYDVFKEKMFDIKGFEKKLGFSISKMPFYYALLGDTSDNIPGVRGVGKKAAQELVEQFDSLEDLYENLDKVTKARTKNALESEKKEAFLSRDLFLLQYHKTNMTQDDIAFNVADWQKARTLFEKLEFTTLLKNLGIEGVDQKEIVKKKMEYWSKFDFRCITTQIELASLCVQLENAEFFAMDTETDGLDPLRSSLVGISFCTKEGQAFYVPCGHKTNQSQLSCDEIIATLKPLLEDEVPKKVLHHAKFDALVLSTVGITLRGFFLDTYVAAQLVTQDWQRSSLKSLSTFFFSEDMLNFEEMVKKNGHTDFSEVPIDIATIYAATDAHQTFKLITVMQEKLREQELESVYYDIENPLIEVLVAMERMGILCDTNVLEKLNKAITHEIAKIEEKINELLDNKEINLNSPRQIEELLFVNLQLPTQKKSSKGRYSTDHEVLKVLAKIHPVPGMIIKHRELSKLKNTYLDALPNYINPKTGRIHTTFSQVKTATGRLSSLNPNLQNIPSDGLTKGNVRAAFKADAGYQFISADYSQIELRVLAHLSQDEHLVNSFLQGHDIHAETSARLFDVELEDVTHEQRQLGKRINFSILYGLTPYGLSKDLGISLKDAKKYIEKYFEQYQGVSVWMDSIIDFAKEHGYVKTVWGRRRYVPGIYEQNKTLYEQARRISINTVAQGTAADLVKLGMIAVYNAFRQEDVDAHILLQIHDELLVRVKKEDAQKTEARIKRILESIVDWSVPFVVQTRIGDNWGAVSK